MGDHEDLPYIVIERRSGGAGAFLWGALLGAGVALLLAPRSGRETQEEIRASMRRVRDAAQGQVDGVRDSVADSITRTRTRFQDQLDAVRLTVEERAEQAREAMEAGRRAAREARSELERRVAEAKEAVAGDAPRAGQRQPAGDVVVTEVTVEEADDRPDLG